MCSLFHKFNHSFKIIFYFTVCFFFCLQTSGKQFENLAKILISLTNAFDDPTVGQKKPNRKSQIYDNLVPISLQAKEGQQPLSKGQQALSKVGYSPAKPKSLTASSPTEVLIDMLRHCGESTDDLPALANRGRSSDNSQGEKTGSSSSQPTSSSSSTNKAKGVREVKSISVVGPRQVYNERMVNESWTQMVSTTDKVNGDYVDLIPFMDDDAHNSSLELDGNKTGSQVVELCCFGFLLCTCVLTWL